MRFHMLCKNYAKRRVFFHYTEYTEGLFFSAYFYVIQTLHATQI